MIGVVINWKTAWMVTKDCPKAFEYKGGWYVWDKDYWTAREYYKKDYEGKENA